LSFALPIYLHFTYFNPFFLVLNIVILEVLLLFLLDLLLMLDIYKPSNTESTDNSINKCKVDYKLEMNDWAYKKFFLRYEDSQVKIVAIEENMA